MTSLPSLTKFVDPAFKTIKPHESGFHIWRIVSLELSLVPKDHHGSFFEGDSYIVYSAQPNANGKLEQHIHFWLGAETSQDESTTAAIKTIELDDYLDGHPIQHREAQGFESPRFRAYFKGGIRILKGGAASGLKHVTFDFAARLFKIKGKRTPLVLEQSTVSWEHFNSGDCFILETRDRIFVWVGHSSNRMERLQAAKVALQLRDEGIKKDRQIIFVDDGQESSIPSEDLADFKHYLPIHQRVVNPPEPDNVDINIENSRNTLNLYRCSDEDGTLKIIQIKQGPLRQSDLNLQDSWIIDNGANGIWVWIGRRASPDERRQGIVHAQGFVTKKGYPKSTRIIRVVDGAEPTEFKMLFADWKDPHSTAGIGRQHSMSRIAPTITTKFDAATLHNTPGLAADTQLVDDGSGDKTVWRLHGKELELVPDEYVGVFFTGDCYLVHYSFYATVGNISHILYYWLGSHSSQDERGTIAWHTIKKDDELHGKAVQVRVVDGKEPPHLLTIFKGSMITFNGGYASLFDADQKDVGLPKEFMIQVHGSDEYNTKSAQVPLKASSLNSGDVFVIVKNNICYVWCGKGSTGDERERAKLVASRWSGQNYTVISEGQEKPEFWELIGGKEPYANDDKLKSLHTKLPARLFHCSNATGVFKAEEIFDFAQSDLVPEDIMVLDVGNAIFIWVGSGANREERLSVVPLVQEYLASDPRERDLDTPLIQVQQGFEPPNFTGFFGFWDSSLWTENYETVRNALESGIIREVPSVIAPSLDEVTKYPLKVLIDRNNLPEDVNLLHKEWHLSDQEFDEVFHMPREEFEKLPQWRQNNYKKAAKLF